MVSSQKKNLILSVSLILAVGFLSISFVSYYIGLNDVRNRITQNDLPLTVDNIYFEILDELQRPIYVSSFMANDHFFKKWVLDGEQQKAELVQYLKSIKEKNNALSSYFISAKTLNYYHPSGKVVTLSDSNPKDSWFFSVRDDVSEYQVNIDFDYLNSDLLTIFINYKMMTEDGTFLGVTGIGIELNVAKSYIEKASKHYKHDIYFLDPAGDLKLSSSEASSQFTNIHDFPPLAGQAKQILSGKRGIYEYKKEGETHYLTTRYIKDFSWIIMVEKSDLESREEIFNNLMINIIICIAVFMIVMGMTHFSLRNYQKELEQVALKDSLTGLYNRHALGIILDKLQKRIDRSFYKSCILLLDIDFFKQVNDDHGHLVGDKILKHVALVISQQLRESDIVCRWGGEEFLVLLENIELSKAKDIAEKIRTSIEFTSLDFNGRSYSVTISIGAGEYKPTDNQDTLLSRVDKAMYYSKQTGRNRVTTVDEMNQA
jgi:diguanylate cyclase (GGDEF)-like protein